MVIHNAKSNLHKMWKNFKGNMPKDYTSLCIDCAHDLVNDMTLDEALAHAKVGLDALIDERTGYQVKRPKDDLNKRLKQYKDGK